MLAEPDELDPELVGQHRLLDHVAQDLVHARIAGPPGGAPEQVEVLPAAQVRQDPRLERIERVVGGGDLPLELTREEVDRLRAHR